MRISGDQSQLSDLLRPRLAWIVGFVAVIWAVEVFNTLVGHRLNALGLHPRTLTGFPGIFLAPVLHQGLGHVLANTLPLLVLGSLVLLRGVRAWAQVTAFVIVVGGFAVWLLGRPAIHVGASGLVMGYFGYLLARGWYQRTVGAALVALAVLLLYGSALWGLLPLLPGVSWEMHFFGFLAGILAAKLMAEEPHP